VLTVSSTCVKGTNFYYTLATASVTSTATYYV